MILRKDFEEAVVREVKEETGLDVKVDHLIGVYSKYFVRYNNGDISQTVCVFFKCSIESGELKVDNKETFELRYFKPEKAPVLFNDQNNDMLNDFIQNKTGIFR